MKRNNVISVRRMAIRVYLVILILLLILSLFSCRTKTTAKRRDMNEWVKTENKVDESTTTEKVVLSNNTSDISTEIIGTTTETEPFLYDFVQDGQSVGKIEIKGKSTFKILSKNARENKVENVEKSQVATVHSSNVGAIKSEHKAKEVIVKDTTTGVYTGAVILVGFVIFIGIIGFYFKKYLPL